MTVPAVAQELINAAQADNWTAVNSLLASTPKATLALIDANTYLNLAYQAGKSSIAHGVDHLDSVRALLSVAVTTTTGSYISQSLPTAVLEVIAGNMSNPQVTVQELNDTINVFASKYGKYTDVNGLLHAVDMIAHDSAMMGKDYLASIRTLLNVPTTNSTMASQQTLTNVLQDIAINQSNPEVTTAELNSTLNIFALKYGKYTDVNTILSIADQIAHDAAMAGKDYLDSVRTLLAITPTNATMASQQSLSNLLHDIAINQSNPQVTAAELNSTFSSFAAKYGKYTDVNTVLAIADEIAHDSAMGGKDNLDSVRTLLSITPTNASMASQQSLSNLLQDIAINQSNPQVTAAELNGTFASFASKYGKYTDVNTILAIAGEIAHDAAMGGKDNLDSVRTLLSITPTNATMASQQSLANVLQDIVINQSNPQVTAVELNSTLTAFTAKYGKMADVNLLLSTADGLIINGLSQDVNYMASVKTLLAAAPVNSPAANQDTVNQMVYHIGYALNNKLVSAAEMNSTYGVFVSKFGGIVDASYLLMAANILSSHAHSSGVDYLDSVRTLLSATPANIDNLYSGTLSYSLEAIAQNQYNPQVTESELTLTVQALLNRYGSHVDLGNFVLEHRGYGFATGAAVVDSLNITQFRALAADADLTSTDVKLLTTAGDIFNGAGSNKSVIFAGAGNDTIDFSTSSSSTGKLADGGTGNDTIKGGNASNDILLGGSGNDTISGGGGNDILDGGFGADIMTGGVGADHFFVNGKGGLDTITDFNKTTDILDLSEVLSYFDPLTHALSEFVSVRASGANTIVSVDADGKGGAAKVDVVTLQNVTNISVNDLLHDGHLIGVF